MLPQAGSCNEREFSKQVLKVDYYPPSVLVLTEWGDLSNAILKLKRELPSINLARAEIVLFVRLCLITLFNSLEPLAYKVGHGFSSVSLRLHYLGQVAVLAPNDVDEEFILLKTLPNNTPVKCACFLIIESAYLRPRTGSGEYPLSLSQVYVCPSLRSKENSVKQYLDLLCNITKHVCYYCGKELLDNSLKVVQLSKNIYLHKKCADELIGVLNKDNLKTCPEKVVTLAKSVLQNATTISLDPRDYIR